MEKEKFIKLIEETTGKKEHADFEIVVGTVSPYTDELIPAALINGFVVVRHVGFGYNIKLHFERVNDLSTYLSEIITFLSCSLTNIENIFPDGRIH